MQKETSTDRKSPLTEMKSQRVRFSEEVVTEVWLRPRTLGKDKSQLFYSVEEIRRFRSESRLNLQQDNCSIESNRPNIRFRNESRLNLQHDHPSIESNRPKQMRTLNSFLSIATQYIGGLKKNSSGVVNSNNSTHVSGENEVNRRSAAFEMYDALYMY